ncbi:MAG: arsenate reductase ArsC [Burkholderiales bacterium]|nr:arsenate reductase ArsC [Burkholderiales bacterium]
MAERPAGDPARPGTRGLHVLFLCTGNSARSIMAESLLRQMGGGRLVAHSAGSRPAGTVNPYAIDQLLRSGLPVDGLRSKSWEEFAAPGAPALDLVITVCDNAAGEICPIWPGHPLTAHWGVPDPAAVDGDDDTKRRAYADACERLAARIARLVRLPIDRLDPPTLQSELREIGRASNSGSPAASPPAAAR